MEQKQTWIIIGIVFAIAVITSAIISAFIVNKLTKLYEDREVFIADRTYAKEKIDNLLNSKTTDADVLNMLNKCIPAGTAAEKSCSKICANIGRTCTLGLIETRSGIAGDYKFSYAIGTCDEFSQSSSKIIQCLCCSEY
ncbi:MAG: hypothetical protein WC323_03350 [Patescibacteria group bacterium]|jgi:hypothetical protein